MICYPYKCDGCGGAFEIVKEVEHYNRIETCPTSGTILTRVFTVTQIYGASVQERKWNPAFGAAMTDGEARAAAKAQGLIEVGTERPERHLKVPEAEYPTFSDDDLRAMTAKP